MLEFRGCGALMTTELLFADRAAIERVQAQYWRESLALILDRHPHYRELFATHGLDAATPISLDDLEQLPITTKADYMATPQRFVLDTVGLPAEMNTVWDTMYTTGTTGGAPTPFVSTTFDFYRILELQRNMLRLRGVRPDDVIANLFPLTRAPHGAWIRAMHAAASMAIPIVAALPGRVSEFASIGASTDEVVRTVERCRTTILWGVPSYLARVVERAIELGADFRSVRMVFVTGEGFAEAARAELVERFRRLGADVSISISYGSTETQGGFVECAPGAGYHNPAPDQIYVEIVDPDTKRRVPDGAPGLVVITHLRRRGTVLVRYSLGDISTRSRERCPHCGASTDRLTTMPRRADELVKIKGMLVNPAVLVEALERELGARPFQAIVESVDASVLAADVLRIRCASGAASDASHGRIADAVRNAVGVTPIVESVAAEALVDPSEAWKLKKFVDQR